MGGEISATHSRENLVLRTKFLANDLPYFTELLAEVASQTKFAGESIPRLEANRPRETSDRMLDRFC